MIPQFVDIGSPLRVLPPGVHDATLNQIESRFAISMHRKHLFSGFKKGVIVLFKAGCKGVFLDGSFITEKNQPNDYDVCWHTIGVDTNLLDPVFLDFSNKREKQKQVYFGEYFPSHIIADNINSFYTFFQKDRDSGNPKGIIRVII